MGGTQHRDDQDPDPSRTAILEVDAPPTEEICVLPIDAVQVEFSDGPIWRRIKAVVVDGRRFEVVRAEYSFNFGLGRQGDMRMMAGVRCSGAVIRQWLYDELKDALKELASGGRRA